MTSGLDKPIGAPEDYNKNLDKNRFPSDIDITVPKKRSSSVGNLEEDFEGIDLGDDNLGQVSAVAQ